MSKLSRMTNLRIGDREREAAADRLSAHHAEGRLGVDELERRLERVNAAVFEADLLAVEADLPSRAPRRRRAFAGAPPLALAATLFAFGIAASVAAGHPIAPLFLLALVLVWRRAVCA